MTSEGRHQEHVHHGASLCTVCVCPLTRDLELVPSLCEVTSKLESQDGSSCNFYPLPYTLGSCFFFFCFLSCPSNAVFCGIYLCVTCHILKDLLLIKKEQCKLPSLSAAIFLGNSFSHGIWICCADFPLCLACLSQTCARHRSCPVSTATPACFCFLPSKRVPQFVKSMALFCGQLVRECL